MSDQRFILIVEDSDEDYRAMMWSWQKAGISTPVIRCKDGDEALDRLFRKGAYANTAWECPSMVVLDLNMPRVGGRAVLEAIKQDHVLKTTPVVILTTSSNPRDVDACYRSGANSYVVKPINLKRLSDMLQKLVHYWMEVVQLPPLPPAQLSQGTERSACQP